MQGRVKAHVSVSQVPIEQAFDLLIDGGQIALDRMNYRRAFSRHADDAAARAVELDDALVGGLPAAARVERGLFERQPVAFNRDDGAVEGPEVGILVVKGNGLC